MISFLKSCVDFLEPPGLVWLALTVKMVVLIRQRARRSLWLIGSAWLIFTLTASLPLSNWLLSTLEDDWPKVDVSKLPVCDAIVVLGGGVEPSELEPSGLRLMIGAERLFTAVKLAREGKGGCIIIGGGGKRQGKAVSEADAARDWIADWQLVTVPVQSLGICQDTHDEAVKVAALVREKGWQRVAVVTSAFHMRRTKAVFEKAGVPVLPVACSYLTPAMRGTEQKWVTVPNASHLMHFEVWLHEVIGWWVYRLRGWI